MIEKRVVLGNRILGVRCSDKCNVKVYNSFFKMVDNFSHELEKLMDECGIPEEVMVNFREGRGKLSGFYYLYDDIVSGNVVVMDIYTKPLLKLKGRELDRELLDTFVHEIIHHSVKSERKTNERVKEFMEGLDL